MILVSEIMIVILNIVNLLHKNGNFLNQTFLRQVALISKPVLLKSKAEQQTGCHGCRHVQLMSEKGLELHACDNVHHSKNYNACKQCSENTPAGSSLGSFLCDKAEHQPPAHGCPKSHTPLHNIPYRFPLHALLRKLRGSAKV